MGYLCNHKMWLPSFPNNLHKIDPDQYQFLGMQQQFDSTQLRKPRERGKSFKYSPKHSEFCSLRCFTPLEDPRTAHQPVFFCAISFSHILFLNNRFLSHEHILLFQYNSCQIYFLMQRKTTPKLSALPHTASISLNAKAFAVFLTTFFLS